MKTVAVEDLGNRLDECLARARQEDILVTRNGKPAALILACTEEDLEDLLLEQDERFAAIIEARRKEYRRDGGVPLEKVEKELRKG